MIRSTLSICLAASLLFACNNGDDATKATKTDTDTLTETKMDKEQPPPPPPAVDTATARKNWEAYMAPGKEHQMMAKWNGTWTGEMTMWMSPDPNVPPTKSVGSAKNRMALGGRYQISEHKSNMMGMPFEGMSILAYDNHKKIFISSWIDNMGTGIMKLEGPWDEATKTITLRGKMVDPSSTAEMQIREVFTIIDDNTQKMEFYAVGPDGKEFKSMEGILKRKN